jgi:hypothetical protein
LEPYDFFLNYNVKSIFKIFKMFWLSFQHYQLTNHFSCKANIWEAYWNIMNLGTKKNLHIEHTLWEVDCHLCYVGGACFLTIYWQFQTVSFWQYFNKGCFQIHGRTRVHRPKSTLYKWHPSIHVFVFFEGRVFDICFGEAGGVGLWVVLSLKRILYQRLMSANQNIKAPFVWVGWSWSRIIYLHWTFPYLRSLFVVFPLYNQAPP